MAPGLLQPSFSTPLTHTEAHAGFVRRLRGEVDMRHRDQLAANLQCQRATRIGCPRRRGSDSQQWSPCSVVLAWAATSPLMTSGRYPHQPAISSRRRWRTSRVQPRTSRRPFLAGTIGRSRRRARRRARARGPSKPARRRPPRPPGLLMIFPRGALPRPRRRRPRRRRARSSSPPRCGRRPTRAAGARQCGDGRRRRS